MKIKELYNYFEGINKEIKELINKEEFYCFIESYKKTGSHQFNISGSNDFLFLLKPHYLKKLKNVFLNNEITIEEYLFILCFIETYLLYTESESELIDVITEEILYLEANVFFNNK